MFHTDTYKKEITADHSQRRLQHLFIRMHRSMGEVGCSWPRRPRHPTLALAEPFSCHWDEFQQKGCWAGSKTTKKKKGDLGMAVHCSPHPEIPGHGEGQGSCEAEHLTLMKRNTCLHNRQWSGGTRYHRGQKFSWAQQKDLLCMGGLQL